MSTTESYYMSDDIIHEKSIKSISHLEVSYKDMLQNTWVCDFLKKYLNTSSYVDIIDTLKTTQKTMQLFVY